MDTKTSMFFGAGIATSMNLYAIAIYMYYIGLQGGICFVPQGTKCGLVVGQGFLPVPAHDPSG